MRTSGHLCHGNIHGRKRALIESVFEYVADNADNLARGLVELRAYIGRNIDLCMERIFSRPVLPRHGLIDDGYFRGLSIIPVSKTPTAQQRDFHGIEVRRRDVAPVPKSVRRAKERAPHHKEWERGTGFERQPGGRAGGNDPRQSAQALAAVAHELIDLLRRLKLRTGERHSKRQYVMRVKARMNRLEIDKAPDEQRSPDQKHQSKRNFSDHQHGPGFVLA